MVQRFELYSNGQATGLTLYVAPGQKNAVLADLRKDFGDVELRPWRGRWDSVEEVGS